MHNWYVVQVFSSREKKVKKALEEQQEVKGVSDLIEEVVVPTENVSEIKQGQQKVVEKRLWPGYLLIKMELTEASWCYVKETQDVIGFLGGEQPSPLTQSEVDELLSGLKEREGVVVQRHQFKEGDHVKIIGGVFEDLMGTVKEVHPEKGRVTVSVSIFGRETQVDDLQFAQVEKSSEEHENV